MTAQNHTATLIRNSVFAFTAFLAFVALAFWPSYFARITQQPTYHAHAHGVALILWCLLLVGQAWLIRTNRRETHRVLGKLSFVLVPLIVVTTVNFVHFRLGDIPVPQLPPAAYYLLALILNALVAFVVLYLLAMRYRANPRLHARFMVCTVFPLFTPVTDRLLGIYAPAVAGLVPTIDGTAVLPVVGFALADLILLGLSIWDLGGRGRRVYAFPVALAVLLAYHVSVLTFHSIAPWRRFCTWFLNLPLS